MLAGLGSRFGNCPSHDGCRFETMIVESHGCKVTISFYPC
jgi:hypothetical protein